MLGHRFTEQRMRHYEIPSNRFIAGSSGEGRGCGCPNSRHGQFWCHDRVQAGRSPALPLPAFDIPTDALPVAIALATLAPLDADLGKQMSSRTAFVSPSISGSSAWTTEGS